MNNNNQNKKKKSSVFSVILVVLLHSLARVFGGGGGSRRVECACHVLVPNVHLALVGRRVWTWLSDARRWHRLVQRLVELSVCALGLHCLHLRQRQAIEGRRAQLRHLYAELAMYASTFDAQEYSEIQ